LISAPRANIVGERFFHEPVFHKNDLGYALINLEIFVALCRNAPGIFNDREREREKEREGKGKAHQ